jgi:hypothetical protein
MNDTIIIHATHTPYRETVTLNTRCRTCWRDTSIFVDWLTEPCANDRQPVTTYLKEEGRL